MMGQFFRRLASTLGTWGCCVTLVGCSEGGRGDEEGRLSAAATVPSGFSDETVATGLVSPTAMAFTPDGRLFVCQQGGQLRVVKNGSLLSAPFVTVSTNPQGERGLLGVAVDPNFESNGYVYVYYTVSSPVHNRVSRFTANGDVASGGETVIVELDALSSAQNHNGGAMHFGPDGKLYIAVGENGNGANAQSMSNRLGKILRLNSDGSIPTDNPFYGTATGANRAIWALGLRNPFTFAFQPGTGRMFVNDVGDTRFEEINDGIAGSNYGWPTTEGTTTDSRFRSPLLAYGHGNGSSTGCSIVGAAFYNPPTPQLGSAFVGKYFFADYCSNWIRHYDPATGSADGFATAVNAPVDLAVGPDGLLYYLMRGGGSASEGRLGRIRASTSQAPSITSQPANRTVAAGQQATFSVTAAGSQPLTYQWQRGTTNIAGATSSSYSLTAQTADSGATFRVIVTNALGSVTSSSATLTVSSASSAPVATLTSPPEGTTYAAGDSIQVNASATDAQDGTLPPSAFTWEIVFHHDTHTHPFLGPATGASSGTFTIPRTGETAANVFYRINLTVRDSSGLTSTVTRDIVPRVATLNLASNPAGLQVTLDGVPVTTPSAVSAVVGMTRTLGVVSPQTLSGTQYTFGSWSDGGAANHSFNVPATNTTYTATFSGGGGPPPGPTLPIRINFQPANAATVSGYLVDSGQVYGSRNGLVYGWSASHTDATRERNANGNQLLDTLVYMHASARWELELPNGSYRVLANVGDPSSSSTNTLVVEGVTYWSAQTLSRNQFASATQTISVGDGRLTLTNGSAANNATRLDFVEISAP